MQAKTPHAYLQPLVLAALCASVGIAGPVSASETAKVQNPNFAKIDDNRDGYLSLAEFTQRGLLAKSFHEADDNRDGRLDSDEFIKASAIEDRVKVARVVDDSVITGKVKMELLKDPVVKGMKVNVETYQGTVQLSGFVDNERQATKAAEVAVTVKGVKHVINNLIVKS